MFPVLPKEVVRKVSNVLSLIIAGDKIAWSLIQRSMKGDDVMLNAKSLTQITYPFKPRMHFLTVLNEMQEVASQIPECELCVVEEYPSTTPTPYMFNFHLQMAQARSTLLALLSSRQPPPEIVSIKTVAVARMFNTFIGNEKVSGQHIVEEIIYDGAKEFITANNSVLESYSQEDTTVKERMSQAFLLNLAYWRLTKQINYQ